MATKKTTLVEPLTILDLEVGKLYSYFKIGHGQSGVYLKDTVKKPDDDSGGSKQEPLIDTATIWALLAFCVEGTFGDMTVKVITTEGNLGYLDLRAGKDGDEFMEVKAT